jgi:ABC-type molybdenum transport system ATPase subunit/photorepair protein PhrA
MKVLDCLPTMADVMEGAEPLLRVAGVSHAFGGQQVLKDAAVELRPGEVVLLRGANGSGKTTLLNILTGNLVPDRLWGSVFGKFAWQVLIESDVGEKRDFVTWLHRRKIVYLL